MRRGLVSLSNDSLELLLDTICNTFGGIIFISLLVVVRLNTTSKAILNTPPTRQSQAELIATDIEREQLTRDLSELKQALSQQQEIASSIVSPDLIQRTRELQRLQAEGSRLLVKKSQTIGETTAAQERLNQLAQDTADRNAKLSKLKSDSESLKMKLEREVAQRSRTAIIPKMVQTELPKKIFFLKRSRLYGPVYLTAGQFNASDFVEGTQGGKTTVDVTSSGGVAVDLKGNTIPHLASKLKGVEPATHVMQLFVWPGSFEHFETVRLAAESVGLRYELTPCEVNTIIQTGTTDSTKPTYVQ